MGYPVLLKLGLVHGGRKENNSGPLTFYKILSLSLVPQCPRYMGLLVTIDFCFCQVTQVVFINKSDNVTQISFCLCVL